MTDSDELLQNELRAAQAASETGRVPDFASSWNAAQRRAAMTARRRTLLAGSAAAAAAVVVAFTLLRGGEDWQYIDTAELLGTTSWSAPSDSLLPERLVDIYGEIPLRMESTGSNGGALL